MIQKITQNSWNFWTVNLIMRAKIVIQSSDFPVRRTGSYRHKKALCTGLWLTVTTTTTTTAAAAAAAGRITIISGSILNSWQYFIGHSCVYA